VFLPWERERVWTDVKKQRIYIPIRGIRKERKKRSNEGRTKKEEKKRCIYAKGKREGRQGIYK
jgi:hypothetical protein